VLARQLPTQEHNLNKKIDLPTCQARRVHCGLQFGQPTLEQSYGEVERLGLGVGGQDGDAAQECATPGQR
jgi:hypothetical protein